MKMLVLAGSPLHATYIMLILNNLVVVQVAVIHQSYVEPHDRCKPDLPTTRAPTNAPVEISVLDIEGRNVSAYSMR